MYTYTCTLAASSADIVIFEWCIWRQYQSIHFDFFDSYRRRLFIMVYECTHIEEDSNV